MIGVPRIIKLWLFKLEYKIFPIHYTYRFITIIKFKQKFSYLCAGMICAKGLIIVIFGYIISDFSKFRLSCCWS